MKSFHTQPRQERKSLPRKPRNKETTTTPYSVLNSKFPPLPPTPTGRQGGRSTMPIDLPRPSSRDVRQAQQSPGTFLDYYPFNQLAYFPRTDTTVRSMYVSHCKSLPQQNLEDVYVLHPSTPIPTYPWSTSRVKAAICRLICLCTY